MRWRWNDETDRSPEVFSYFETTFPLQKAKKLIGNARLGVQARYRHGARVPLGDDDRSRIGRVR
jgi:hypothetical protein